MMTSRLRDILLTLSAGALTLAAGGCADRMPAWSQFTAFPSGHWTPEMIVTAEPWPVDSIILSPRDGYRLSLCLRYHLPAPRTAMIVVEQEAPASPLRSDTLRIDLIDPNGSPLGRGAYGIYTIECPVPSPPVMSEGYSVALYPLLALTSVSEVGLILNPPDTPQLPGSPQP